MLNKIVKWWYKRNRNRALKVYFDTIVDLKANHTNKERAVAYTILWRAATVDRAHTHIIEYFERKTGIERKHIRSYLFGKMTSIHLDEVRGNETKPRG